MKSSGLGLIGLSHVQFAVHDLERAHKLYEERFGFRPVYRSSRAVEEKEGQKSVVYLGGDARIMVTQSLRENSDAARFLRLHPEGVMTVAFNVKSVDAAFKTLESRQGTPIADATDVDGQKEFEIATPLGEVNFRFIERKDHTQFAPGWDAIKAPARPGAVPWIGIDHITSNLRTMRPLIDWYRHVMGFEQFWEIQFHTTMTAAGKTKDSGTGLKSIVMWDPESQIKFATNEPLRPFFRQSQIERFVVDNRGPGVQHIALSVPRIIDAVDWLQAKGFKFLAAPATYYEMLGARLKSVGWDVEKIREPMAELKKRNILVDGSSEGYMLQIFQEELKAVDGREEAGPAFFEIIQRAGDRGFGYGNFRALFEAIEAAQSSRKD
ncbi:MAG: 4-hydroxyphenylpyruvate dioxygenase [Myxococcota bacterium]